MSGHGLALVAWLNDAISERERAAQVSVEQTVVNLAGAEPSSVSTWRVIERTATGTFVATSDQWDRVAEVVPTYGGAHAEHIALNDPASVLRRCAADRKLLGLHQPVDCGGFGCDCDQKCGTCDWTESQEQGSEPGWGFADPHFYPCPTIRAVAEGYGWTAEQTSPSKGDQVM